MPMSYSMRDAQSVARRAASDVEAFLQARSETRSVRNVEDDPQFQQIDVDLVWETQKGNYLVEIKGDRIGHQSGNFFFETVSNKARQTPGCFLYSEADLLFYYFIETGKLYILPLPETRRWFLEKEEDFELRETTTPVGKRRYTTVGRLVPIEHVVAQVEGVWHELLPAPKVGPFLKWAGGKRQLLPSIVKHLPPGLAGGKINAYAEPFLGSGAVFFRLVRKFHFERVLLADQNPELILVYRVVRERVDALIEALEQMQADFLAREMPAREKYFYAVRAAYNASRAITDFERTGPAAVVRAAQMVFLNRTCYNGLFRVNGRGEFNVPFGKYKKPRICDRRNLEAVSAVLQNVRLHLGDFEEIDDWVDNRTFVYFDPPYRPISKTASFNAYDTSQFDDQAQRRLAAFFRRLDGKGAHLMLSNSDPKNVDPADDFFDRLYAGFHIRRIAARRNINSNPKKRGAVSELLITNPGSEPPAEN